MANLEIKKKIQSSLSLSEVEQIQPDFKDSTANDEIWFVPFECNR